jgi:hypothetical protein
VSRQEKTKGVIFIWLCMVSADETGKGAEVLLCMFNSGLCFLVSFAQTTVQSDSIE